MEHSRQERTGAASCSALQQLLKLVQSQRVWNPHETPASGFYFKHKKEIDNAELALFSQDERDDLPDARVIRYYLSSVSGDRDVEYPRRKLVAILSKMIKRCGGEASTEGHQRTSAPLPEVVLRSKMKKLFPEVTPGAWVSWETKGKVRILAPGGVGSDLNYHLSRVRDRLLRYAPAKPLPADWVKKIDRRISATFGGG